MIWGFPLCFEEKCSKLSYNVADAEETEFETIKKFQSLVEDKALFISERGALADSSCPEVIRSFVALKGQSF